MSTTLHLSKTAALVAAIAILFTSGCVGSVIEPGDLDDPGFGEGDGNGNGDGIDNGNGDGTGGGDLACAAAPSYSIAIDQEAEQLADDEGDTYLELYAELSAAPLNELEISLWDGAGVFENVDLGPGTYQIAGLETSYDECGVCVVIFGDVDPVTDLERQMMMAQSGTVQITSVAGTMSGTLNNVVFAEVNPATSAVVEGGCTTTIPFLTFNAPLVLGSTP